MSNCIDINGELYIIYNNYSINNINREFCSRNTYHLKPGKYFFLNLEDQLVDEPEDDVAFKIAKLEGNYYIFDKEVFDLTHNFKIEKELVSKLKHKHFVKNPSKISILKKIDSLINEDVYIVKEDLIDENISTITWDEFSSLVNSFPTYTTARFYLDKLVAEKIEGYFELKKKYDEELEKHLERTTRRLRVSRTLFSKKEDKEIVEAEIYKFNQVISLLESMLENRTADEKEWQLKILDILLFIYPQYHFVIDEIGLSNMRRVDFILVDLFNNIDIIEIKTPEKSLLRKSKYRDHYIPSHELTGTVMQLEFYLRELNENSSANIKKIQSKLSSKNFTHKMKINNVKGMIIMGRTNEFNDEQKESYRILKNQYANIISIFSYDELLDMLNLILERLNRMGIHIESENL